MFVEIGEAYRTHIVADKLSNLSASQSKNTSKCQFWPHDADENAIPSASPSKNRRKRTHLKDASKHKS